MDTTTGGNVFRFALAGLFAMGNLIAAADGAVFNWTGAVDDHSWNNPGNYAENMLPGENDIVLLPQNAEVALNQTDSASCALVSSLQAVKSGTNTKVTFTIDVPKDKTLALDCAITSTGESYNDTSWQNIAVHKTGEGRLELNSASRIFVNKVNYSTDYFSSWYVDAGTLRFPQNYPEGAYGHDGLLILAEGATCVLGAGGGNGTVFIGISGLGDITAEATTPQWLRVDGTKAPEPFAGRIVGNVRYDSRGYVRLTGEESTMVGPDFRIQYLQGRSSVTGNGNTYVAKIGNAFEESSVGYCSNIVFYNFGGRLHYTGSGETTGKKFDVNFSSSDAPTHFAEIDAGPNGGLTLAGAVQINSSHPLMHMLHLSGDNVLPSAITGPIIAREDATFHIFKEGMGAWNLFYNPKTTLSGAFSVLAGTLGFDTVAAKGTVSALGTAACTQQPYHGQYVAESNVTWAVKLGCGTDAAVRADLAYVGDTNCLATGRTIALDGTGAILNNGTGRLEWRGATVLDGAGDATLVLGGANARDNVLDEVSDGPDGRLSLVKEGTGTWRLGTNCTFSGKLDVQGGKLLLGTENLWQYYRWVIKATFNTTSAHSAERVVGLKALCLFDADGANRVKGLSQEGDWSLTEAGYYRSNPYSYRTYFGGAAEALDISEGHLRLTKYSGKAEEVTLNGNDLACIFSEPAPGATSNIFARTRPMTPPLVDDETSWFVLTFKPVVGKPITRWDFVNDYCTKDCDYQMISNCTLEASMDGLAWTQLDEIVNDQKPTRSTWQSDGADYDGTCSFDPATAERGRSIAAGPAVDASQTLSHIAALSVAPGAEVDVVGGGPVSVPKFVVSTVGMGTVRGLALAEGGVIDIVGMVPQGETLTVAADFSDVVLPANYTLVVNGGTGHGRAKLAADRTAITVLPLGTVIIFR